MTMDVSKRKNGIKSEVSETDEQVTSPKITTKRPFDVAFLMLPDERLKHKNTKVMEEQQHEVTSAYENNNDCDDEPSHKKTENISLSSVDLHKLQGQAKYFQGVSSKQQVFDDPALFKVKSTAEADIYKQKSLGEVEQKSAFTKVSMVSKERRVSPSLSISPDISYQQSLSPSPPARNYQSYSTSVIPPTQVFRSQNISAYQNTFMPDAFTAPTESPFLQKTPAADILQPNFSKLRPMLGQYRSEIGYNYAQFPTQDVLKMGPELKFPPDIRSPAAAILTTLLPPSLAALSLPAQNVCAKCNVTFRMTSDLVYHMRSHHKNDAVDVSKRRREEKLKCPVCDESFRERHHLTRHMTAHQDKDEDEEPDMKKKGLTNFSK